MAEAKLYVIPGSHPSRTTMLMLERKGHPVRTRDQDRRAARGSRGAAERFHRRECECEMAMRVVPEFPGRTPQIFPADWLAGLRR